MVDAFNFLKSPWIQTDSRFFFLYFRLRVGFCTVYISHFDIYLVNQIFRHHHKTRRNVDASYGAHTERDMCTPVGVSVLFDFVSLWLPRQNVFSRDCNRRLLRAIKRMFACPYNVCRIINFPSDTCYYPLSRINFYIYYIINIFAEALEQWRRARWPRAWRSPRSLIRKSNSNSNQRATAQYLAVLLVKTLRWATEIVPATSAVWHREATWSRRSVCGEKSPTAMNDVGCKVLTPVSSLWGRCCRTTRARNFLR